MRCAALLAARARRVSGRGGGPGRADRMEVLAEQLHPPRRARAGRRRQLAHQRLMRLGPLRERLAGRRVGLIACGANLDAAALGRYLTTA